MKSRVLIVLIAFVIMPVVLFPVLSHAINLTGESNTYLQFRQATTDQSRLIPLYEYLNFRLDDIADNKISFHYGGWGKVDLDDRSYGRNVDADLQYAYMSFKSDKNNIILNFGRLIVTDGGDAEKIDGVYARTDLKYGFSVSAYAGHPVEEILNGVGSDSILGGRLSYQIPSLLTLGVSGLKETGGSDPREEVGADLWLRPIKSIDITGRSTYNAVTDGWMEHAYHISMGPYSNFRFSTEASWINYRDYFTAATVAVFNFMPGVLNPAEKLRLLGEEVSYSINDNISVSADYKNYGYNIQGSANYFGGKVSYAVPGSGGAGFTAHRMDGQTDSLRYSEFRVYGFKKFGKTDLTLDLLDIDYDRRLNGVKNAYSASLIGGFNITDKLRVAADVDYYHNPVYNHDFRTLLHLICKFDTSAGGGGGGTEAK
ncbi:MAG: hypothetical protein HQL08_14120 [Nitrospirae bacterium]|nr:hypothetical protein [Nitrospirota bacterium]